MREELKRLKRLLKNFPAKGLSSETKVSVEEIQNFITVKKNENVSAKIVDFSSKNENSYKIDTKYGNLLGELLGYLRLEKMMTTLMLCRRIDEIEVNGEVAFLKSNDNDLQELKENEKHNEVLKIFFEKKGLSYKICEKEINIDMAEKLREFFGDKLIVR